MVCRQKKKEKKECEGERSLGTQKRDRHKIESPKNSPQSTDSSQLTSDNDNNGTKGRCVTSKS
jgi:hypothetical protein